jgi:two-component system, cell cycle sensor histidine kinase DivJ
LNYLSTFKFPHFVAWIDGLTHESVAGQSTTLARHKSFILARLAAACTVLISAPTFLFLHGWPNNTQLLIFLIAQAPLLSIVLLSRTGNLLHAQTVSILGWLALAAAVDWAAPGMESATILLSTLALVEAALTLEPLIVAAIVGLAFGLLFVDVGVNTAGFLQPGEAAAATHLAWLIAPLLLYVAILAIGDIRAEHARWRADRRNADDLKLLTGAIGDIVLHLSRSGDVISIAGETHESYGLSRLDLQGRGLFQRIHVADRPPFLKLIVDAIAIGATAHAVVRVRVGARPTDDDNFIEPTFNYFDVRTCPVDTGREGADVICVLRDVTVARRADEELASARQEAERATAAKTRFLANVSHELRTPLNAIIGFSEMLGNDALAPADVTKRREYAQIIRDSGQHLLEVVNSILDISKIESGSMELHPEKFFLPDLMDQCCNMMRLRAEQSGVSLSCHYQKQIESIVADRRACKQILLNLLSNAVKFTPAAGRVEMRLRSESGQFVISVLDSGIGISPADLTRLGDPFFQASSSLARSHEGTGLGLSVVRGLVGLHAGSIMIESSANAGTCVTVRLPLDSGSRRPENILAKIETVFRQSTIASSRDLQENAAVKKIA